MGGMYFTVAIFKPGLGAPSCEAETVDDAIFQVAMAEALSNLDPEDLEIILYDSNDEPVYRLHMCNLNEAEVYDFKERKERG